MWPGIEPNTFYLPALSKCRTAWLLVGLMFVDTYYKNSRRILQMFRRNKNKRIHEDLSLCSIDFNDSGQFQSFYIYLHYSGTVANKENVPRFSLACFSIMEKFIVSPTSLFKLYSLVTGSWMSNLLLYLLTKILELNSFSLPESGCI